MSIPEFNRSIAVIIGINKYSYGIPRLKTAVNDARALAALLREKYKYEVLLLLDKEVTRDRFAELLTAFNQQKIPFPDGRTVKLRKDDRVLFYFAGHGIALDGLDSKDGPAGYILPQDAQREDDRSFVPMQELHDALIALPCRHLLAILDCCFAGAFRWSGFTRDAVRSQRVYAERYDRFINSTARQVITSAAYDEKALDFLSQLGDRGERAGYHSPFAELLLQGLDQASADLTNDGLITATELYVYLSDELKNKTEKQTPGIFQLKSHSKGEYIFRVPGKELKLEKAPPLDYESNPYQGLKPFEEEDSEVFFGRERMLDQLWEHLQNQKDKPPVTVLLGDTGSGKSSLVKAGLLPRLRQEENWHIIGPIRPGTCAVMTLKEAIASHCQETKQQVPTMPMIAILREWRRNHPTKRLLLVIDQFHELVTMRPHDHDINNSISILQGEYGEPEEPEEPEDQGNDIIFFSKKMIALQKNFLFLLRRMVHDPMIDLEILLVLRSDFQPYFEPYFSKVKSASIAPYTRSRGSHGSGLEQLNLSMLARFSLSPMTQDELRSVIEKPAEAKVLDFDPPELVDQLINDVVQMPGALPLLSFTLSELYLKYLQRRGNDRTLRLSDYHQLGGVKASLTNRATEEYNKLLKLDPAYDKTVRWLMLRMVAIDGGSLTRRRVPRSELRYSDKSENQRVNKAIDNFSAARLIVEGLENDGDRYVEPAHDILVGGWDLLLNWKNRYQEQLTLQRLVNSAAIAWRDHRRPVSDLWDENSRLPSLKQIRKSSNNWLNQLETEFVDRSLRQKRKYSLVNRITLTIVIFSLLGFGSLSFLRRVQAERETLNALSSNSEALLSSNQEFDDLQALISSLQAAQKLQQAVWPTAEQRHQIRNMLHKVVYGVRERNRIEDKHHQLWSVSFSPNGSLIATADSEGMVRLWSKDGNSLLQEIEGHAGNIWSVSFSPNSKLLATASADGTARLWDLSGKQLAEYKGHIGRVLSVSFSPNGQQLATTGDDGTVRLWDLSGKQLSQFKAHKNLVWRVIFHPTAGDRLATASDDGTARLWNLQGKKLAEFKVHKRGVNSISFSPDGNQLATAVNDGTVGLWNLQGQKLAEFNGHIGRVLSVRFSPDGKVLATAGEDGTARLWSQQSRQQLRAFKGHQNWVTSLSFSPDSKLLVTASLDRTTRLWDLQGKQVQKYIGHNRINSVSFSPDGKLLATAGNDGAARLWDRESGQQLGELKGHRGIVWTVSFSPNGQQLATAGNDSTFRLWDLQGEQLLKVTGNRPIRSLSFSPDGSILATAEDDPIAKLWDLQGNQLAEFKGHSDNVLSVSFSPDGLKLATAGKDGTFRLWNLQGEELLKVKSHSGWVNNISFSPDGQQLASAGDDGIFRLWDLQGKLLAEGKGHKGSIQKVIFSPDGQQLATAGNDGTARLWNLQANQLAEFPAHAGWVTSISFNPDGTFLATAGDDGTAKLWQIEGLEQLLLRGCSWLGDYLQSNPNVSEKDRKLCDRINAIERLQNLVYPR